MFYFCLFHVCAPCLTVILVLIIVGFFFVSFQFGYFFLFSFFPTTTNTTNQLDEYLSDDFLFPMTSRLSYASSPESDLDLSPEPRPAAAGAQLNASSSSKNGGGLNASGLSSGKSPPTEGRGEGRLIKSSSDPSIATQDDLGMGTGHASPLMTPPKFLQPLPVNSHLSNGVRYRLVLFHYKNLNQYFTMHFIWFDFE